jgi:peroxiredoxin Q/BCP
MAEFHALSAAVIGISTDTPAAQKRFSDKVGLTFPLLGDPGKEICRAYGVLGKLGRARRASFLVDGEGTVRRTYPKVDAKTHALEVLQDLRSMA